MCTYVHVPEADAKDRQTSTFWKPLFSDMIEKTNKKTTNVYRQGRAKINHLPVKFDLRHPIRNSFQRELSLQTTCQRDQ